MVINKKYIVIITIITSFFFGQTPQDLQKMQQEYTKLQRNQQQGDVIGQIERTDQEITKENEAVITPYLLIDLKEKKSDNYFFGYDFFTKRDTVTFWENLPTPSNYLLGPGDELIISLWGETQRREEYTISREGKIYDNKVGLLHLTGKTIGEAKSYLKDQFGRIYSTMKGRNPSTFIDVSLGQLRSINVNFVGQVKFPGVYPVHPFSTVITGLIQSGGVDTTGSLRNIQIKRDGSLHSTVDLYAYLIKGEIPENIQLRDQDIVLVPVRSSEVKVDSAVINPGIYEGASGETVYDIIQYAGGPNPKADNMVSLRRILPLENRNNVSNLENFYLDIENTKLINTQNGDQIFVRYMFDEQKFVQIIGQVKSPGIYNFYEGLKLTDLIELAGGLKDSTFNKSVYMEQAEIIRRNPDSRYEKIININLSHLIASSHVEADVPLQNLDRIVIHANLNFFERKNVQIVGEVNIPGYYPLIKDGESLKSLITRAGELTPRALENGVSIYREKTYFEDPPEDQFLNKLQEQTVVGSIQDKEKENVKIKLAWEGLSVSLMPGDSIVVKEKTGSVFVTGEVYSPGLVEFQRSKSVRYYLNSAGGINNYGDNDNVIVVYPNGITVPWRLFRTPKVTDGSTIVVYQKADLTPFNVTAFASDTVSLLSSLVTIIVLSKQIGQ